MRETTCCLSGLPSIRGRDALLSEDERSLTPDERDDMLALAHRMQMGDRVPRALAFCPRSDALEDPLIGMIVHGRRWPRAVQLKKLGPTKPTGSSLADPAGRAIAGEGMPQQPEARWHLPSPS